MPLAALSIERSAQVGFTALRVFDMPVAAAAYHPGRRLNKNEMHAKIPRDDVIRARAFMLMGDALLRGQACYYDIF